jgi:hypothetical protein
VSDKPSPEVLRKAAQVLREGGWVQGIVETPRGQHCTLGALRKALHYPRSDHLLQPEVDLLSELIGGAAPSGVWWWEAVSDWNDAVGRTAADAITLLEQAAEKAEADR